MSSSEPFTVSLFHTVETEVATQWQESEKDHSCLLISSARFRASCAFTTAPVLES